MNMSIEFEPSSRAALLRALETAPEKTKHGISGWVKRSALRVERQAKQEVPVREGVLQNSIHTAFGHNGMEAKVKPTVKYALYVHEGTGIYGPKRRPIVARSGKMLSWVGSSGRIYARSVRGIKPNPFMKRAYDKSKRTIEGDATKTVSNIVGSI